MGIGKTKEGFSIFGMMHAHCHTNVVGRVPGGSLFASELDC